MFSWKFLNMKYMYNVSPEEGQQLQQKYKKRRKQKGENNITKSEKPKDIGHFLI